jgi:hypothetical protein
MMEVPMSDSVYPDMSKLKIQIDLVFESWEIVATWPAMFEPEICRNRTLFTFGFNKNEQALLLQIEKFVIEYRESVRHRRYTPTLVWDRDPRLILNLDKNIQKVAHPPSLPPEIQEAVLSAAKNLIKVRFTV